MPSGSFALRRSLNLFPSALFRQHSRSSRPTCVSFSLPLRFFPTPSGSLRSGHTATLACFSDRSPSISGGRPSRLCGITPWEETAIRPGKESQSGALCRQQPAHFRLANRSLQSNLSRPQCSCPSTRSQTTESYTPIFIFCYFSILLSSISATTSFMGCPVRAL